MKKQLNFILFLCLFAPLAGFAQTKSPQQELDAYYQKKTKDNSVLEAQVAASALSAKYGGDQEMETKLNKIIVDDRIEQEKLFAKFTGQELLDKLKSLVLKTDSLKQNCIVSKTGKTISNSVFSDVLRYSQSLKLSQGQIDSLTQSAINFDKTKRSFTAKNPGMKFNAKPQQKKLEKILNDQQYESYLIAKNEPTAEKWAVGDWAEMKNYGISDHADSAQVFLAIKIYDMRRLMFKEKYADDPAKLAIAIAEIDKTIPEQLKLLKSAKAHKNPTGQNAAKSSFTW